MKSSRDQPALRTWMEQWLGRCRHRSWKTRLPFVRHSQSDVSDSRRAK